MFKTTVVWLQSGHSDPFLSNPTPEQSQALNEMADSMYPESQLSYQLSIELSKWTVTRTWPTQEMAQTWADYLLANYDVDSVTVEPVDPE